MKIKTGKLKECFVFLPALHLSWIETPKGTIYYLQLGWIFWYIQITISNLLNSKVINGKQKYKKALKRAKKLLEDMDKGDYFASKGDIENIFPELKENEKIKK